MNTPAQIFLASRSPRRRQLLDQIGVRYAVLDVDVAEQVGADEAPADYVQRVALAKARAGWRDPARTRPAPVLGADTEVVADGQVLGKPADREHGLELLRLLSGAEHEVISTVAVVQDDRAEWLSSRSRVWFRSLSSAERVAYWDSGEPWGKAGAYAIQGLAAAFIERLDGSYSGVMGLPLFETCRLLARFGIDVLGGE